MGEPIEVRLTDGEVEMLREMMLMYLANPQSESTRQRCRTVMHKLGHHRAPQEKCSICREEMNNGT
jgi:hypothetical protein